MKFDKYFLGGISPAGFATGFGGMIDDNDYYTYIIKGSPGGGKSSFIHSLSEKLGKAENSGTDPEFYYCASDPDSLDAAVFKERKIIFVDGTHPHVFEPKYAGVSQKTIDLGLFLDTSNLKTHKDEVKAAADNCSQYHERCKKFIAAMSSVTGDTFGIAGSALDKQKLSGFSERFSKKNFPKKNNSVPGKITFKQMSALTPLGYLTHIPEDKNIYYLNDSFYVGSDKFLRSAAADLTSKGYDITVSLCYLTNERSFEHIRVPELSLAIISSTPLNGILPEGENIVNFNRFYDKNMLKSKKLRLKFNAGASKSLLSEAVNSMKSAKEAHDKLEKFYSENVDFDSIRLLSVKLAEQIEKGNI